MINSGSVQQGSPYLRVLTDDQIYEIKRAAFDVMYHAGFKVLHAGARKMLKKPGGHFLNEPHTVKHFRRELSRSDLLTRQPYETWKAEGGKDMGQRIQDRIIESWKRIRWLRYRIKPCPFWKR